MARPAAPGPVWTIVVAGGGASRFGEPKQYVVLAARPALDWAVQAAATVSDGIVVVVPPGDVDRWTPSVDVAVSVVAGGHTRSASVRLGLAAVPDDAAVVLVHDAARPAASVDLFARVVAAVQGGAAGVVPGIEVVDTLRRRDGRGVDRSEFLAVQTPQGFVADLLRLAHRAGVDASDDATLVEAAGGSIVVVPGEPTNTKLTTPVDRAGLEATLRSRHG